MTNRAKAIVLNWKQQILSLTPKEQLGLNPGPVGDLP